MLTRSGADAIVSAPKEIHESLTWLAISTRSGTMYRLQAGVACPTLTTTLDLRGFIGKTNYGFTLLYEAYPVREYHYHAKHHNPGCEIITGHHKHYWDENFGKRMAYVPSDIRPSDNINVAFHAFLRECNIDMIGRYERVPETD